MLSIPWEWIRMRQNNKKTWSAYGMLFCVVALLPVIVSAAPPAIGEIMINPVQPAVQSLITFTVDVTGEQVLGVYIIVQECNEKTGICYTPQNMSMSEITQGTYQTRLTLIYPDATYIQYSVNVHSATGWNKTPDIKTNLAEPSNGSNDGSTNTKSPGFEIFILVLSLSIVGSVLLRKKRS